MCEDVARTVHIARQLGDAAPIAQADIDQLYDRYQNVYGQERLTEPMTISATAARRSGSSPAASTSTGRETLRPGRRPVRSRSSARSTASGGLPAEIVGKPVLTDAGGDPPGHARGQRRRRTASA